MGKPEHGTKKARRNRITVESAMARARDSATPQYRVANDLLDTLEHVIDMLMTADMTQAQRDRLAWNLQRAQNAVNVRQREAA